MNTEITDLALLFTSAFVGATIAFLAALITFTFHHGNASSYKGSSFHPMNPSQETSPSSSRKDNDNSRRTTNNSLFRPGPSLSSDYHQATTPRTT